MGLTQADDCVDDRSAAGLGVNHLLQRPTPLPIAGEAFEALGRLLEIALPEKAGGGRGRNGTRCENRERRRCQFRAGHPSTRAGRKAWLAFALDISSTAPHIPKPLAAAPGATRAG